MGDSEAPVKAADLDDRAVLLAVVEDARARGVERLGACTWTLAESAFPSVPTKVVAAKLRALRKRGLVEGSVRGRGDWLLTEAGRQLVEREGWQMIPRADEPS